MKRPSRLPILAVPLVLALSSCGGDSKADKLEEAISAAEEASITAPTNPEPDPSPPDEAESTAGVPAVTAADSPGSTAVTSEQLHPRHWDIGKTASWGGFEVTVASVDNEGRRENDTISVDLEFLNQTSDVRQMRQSDYSLEVDGLAYTDQGFDAPPQLPAGGHGKLTSAFVVDGAFDIGAAVLIFGAPDQNQTIIPLGEGEVESFEARSLPVVGDLSSVSTTIAFTGDAALEASYEPGDRDVYFVHIPVDVSFAGESTGGELLTPSQFTLQAPDGISYVATTTREGDLIAEALYPDKPPINVGLGFKIDGADPGIYTITFTDADGTMTTATVEMEPAS